MLFNKGGKLFWMSIMSELFDNYNYHFHKMRFYLIHLCIKCTINIQKKKIRPRFFETLLLFPFEIRKVLTPKTPLSRKEVLRIGVLDIRRFLDKRQ